MAKDDSTPRTPDEQKFIDNWDYVALGPMPPNALADFRKAHAKIETKKNAPTVATTKFVGPPDTATTPEQQGMIDLAWKMYKSAGAGGGGGPAVARPMDMRKMYADLRRTTNRAGAATLQEMQRLANLAGTTSSNIGASGEQAASALQKIYNEAATGALEGARMAGVEGSGMRPVSGGTEDLVRRIQGTGATMADYLKANQLVDAKTAGFINQLVQAQAPAQANDMAIANELFVKADMAQRRRDYERALAAARASGAGSGLQNLQTQMEALKLVQELKGGSSSLPALSEVPLSARTETDMKLYRDDYANLAPEEQISLKAQYNIGNANDYANYRAREAYRTTKTTLGK